VARQACPGVSRGSSGFASGVDSPAWLRAARQPLSRAPSRSNTPEGCPRAPIAAALRPHCDIPASVLNPNSAFSATPVTKLKSQANSYWFLTNLPGQSKTPTRCARDQTGGRRGICRGVMKQTTRGYARHGNEPRILADIADFVQSLARSLFDPYRPELYYMRGPGPKWHAKHDGASAQYQPVPVLVRVRAKR